jgi:NADPH:quinone reductase-like Zn-dependent oxidoreductase
MYLVGDFQPGQSILWHAGASSVSISGIQLALADRASAVYATARQDAKCDFVVNALGATAAFNTTDPAWSQKLLEATGGKGVDLIVDFIGKDVFQGNLDAVARDGRVVQLGAMSGTRLPEGTDIGAFVRKRVRFEGSTLRSRDEAYQGRLRDRLVEHALPKFRDGSFKVFVEKVFDWEEIVEAHKLMESNKTMGKIICTIGKDW